MMQASEARISELEKASNEVERLKADAATRKEKYVSMKKELAESKKALKVAKRDSARAVQELETVKSDLAETAQRADALMKEGLALSQKQGNHEQVLRKVRKLKRESDAQVEKLKASLDTARKEKEQEIGRAVDRKDKEIECVVRERDEARAALEIAREELDAHSKSLTKRKQDSSAAQKNVQAAKSQLQERIEATRELQARIDSLEKDLEDSQLAMEQREADAERTIEDLRREKNLQGKRLREAESRNEQLAASAASATAPLLRQIEALQSVGKARLDAIDASQDALLVRAVTAEKGEARVTKLLRQAEEQRTQLTIRVAELETGMNSMKSQHSRIKTDAARAVERAKQQEREVALSYAKLAETVAKHESKMAEMSANEVKLRQSRLELQEKVEEMKHSMLEQRQSHEAAVADLESSISEQQRAHNNAVTMLKRAQVGYPSRAEDEWAHDYAAPSQGEILSSTLSLNGAAASADSGGAPLLKSENEKQELSRAIGHAKSLQQKIKTLERGRDALAEELATLSEKCRVQDAEIGQLPVLRAQLAEMVRRNDVALVLLGERDERIEELMMDIQDVKETYRMQIDALTRGS